MSATRPSPDLQRGLKALSAEAADKDVWRLTTADKDQRAEPPLPQAPPVHKVGQPQRSDRQPECYRCGGKHHPSACTCKQLDCHFCKKKGHIAKMCRKKACHGIFGPPKYSFPPGTNISSLRVKYIIPLETRVPPYPARRRVQFCTPAVAYGRLYQDKLHPH